MLIYRTKTVPIDIVSVILVIFLASAGQILAKAGVAGFAGAERYRHLRSGINVLLVLSYTSFLLRGVLWSLILHRRPVSRVYPFLALSFPIVLLAGILLFGETLSFGKAAGSVLIFSGTYLMMPRIPK